MLMLLNFVSYIFPCQPDPLIEALESVVGGRSPLDGRLQAAEADAEVQFIHVFWIFSVLMQNT